MIFKDNFETLLKDHFSKELRAFGDIPKIKKKRTSAMWIKEDKVWKQKDFADDQEKVDEKGKKSDNANNMPRYVATPFPPLNFNQIGKR